MALSDSGRTRGAGRSWLPVSMRAYDALQQGRSLPAGSQLWRELSSGGPAGNAVLTSLTAALLLGLLGAEGVTIVQLRPLLSEHMFIGMVLIPVVALKMASTGYRFARYYTGYASYVRKGPPPLPLRLVAPLVVLSSITVLGTGVVLLFDGPGSRGTFLPLHKLSFFAWLAFMAVHVLGHLLELPPALRAEYHVGSAEGGSAERVPGRAGRQVLAFATVAAGVLLAWLVIPRFAPWLHEGFGHHGGH